MARIDFFDWTEPHPLPHSIFHPACNVAEGSCELRLRAPPRCSISPPDLVVFQQPIRCPHALSLPVSALESLGGLSYATRAVLGKSFCFSPSLASACCPQRRWLKTQKENSLWPEKSAGAHPCSRRATTATPSNIMRPVRS